MSGKRRERKKMIMEAKKGGLPGKESKVIAKKPEAVQESSPVLEEVRNREGNDKKRKVVQNLFLQYNDLEFSDKLMFEAAINDYCQKAGVIMESIESVNLYVKPQEGKAYYVINDDSEKTGLIDL